MAKHTKKNLLTWIKNWDSGLKRSLAHNMIGEEAYRKKLLLALKKAAEGMSAEAITGLLEVADINSDAVLWPVINNNRNSKDLLVAKVIAIGCGYETEEDVWADMEYDLGDEKKAGKSRAWYAFWSRSK